MKNKKVFNTITFLLFLNVYNYSQTFDMIGYFNTLLENSLITYDYSYEEFSNTDNSDSSIILESFNGIQQVHIKNIIVIEDTVFYCLEISKIGTKIIRTFFDTLSVENINYKYNDSLYEIRGINCQGGSRHILGWIFPDTLIESVVDPLDPVPMYPYSKLFRYYNPEEDGSLYSSGDSLYIHYRSKYVNYYDSYFSVDYLIKKDSNLVNYSRYYNYYSSGFREEYQLNKFSIVDIDGSYYNDLPKVFMLLQNYPNPFNPFTRIKYSIPQTSFVSLKIYDILGNEVFILVNAEKAAGTYYVQFDGSNFASGIYFYRLQSGNFSLIKKFVLLK